MNAPTLSIIAAEAGSRDPFGAYVCDQATAKIIKAAIAEHGWPEERIEVGNVDAAVRAFAVTTSPLFLIIDLSESEDPRSDINALAEVCEPGTIVLALGSINDINLYRDLIASGIQDYIVKPVSTEAIREAILVAEATLSQPAYVEPAAPAVHRMCAFIGVRGGVGASTLAAACAWLMAHDMKQKVALLDLDMHFGTGALAFDLEPGRGLLDALENPGRVDSLFLERATIKESERLSILGAEAPLIDAMLPDPSALGHLQAELMQGYDNVLIDWPRHYLPAQSFLANHLTDVVIVTDLSLAAARDAIRLLAFIKDHAPQAKVHLVANKVGPVGNSELSRKDFESSVERKIDLIIPLDVKNAVMAAKKGRSLSAIAKSGKARAALRNLTVMIRGGEDDAEKSSLVKTLGALLRKVPKRKK